MRYSCPVKSLLALLRSTRLAVVLILVISVLSLLSTFVPQGRDEAFYLKHYPPGAARIMIAVGFVTFFQSWLFIVPVLLFALCLGACAVHRFVERVRHDPWRRIGPDIVHLGLLLLIAGALCSAVGRREQLVVLGAGDQAQLLSSLTLRVDSLAAASYASGAPKEWSSTVSVSRGAKQIVSSYAIRVNHPLRCQDVSIYQTSWALEGTLAARDAAGSPVRATTGQGFEEGDTIWLFDAVEQGRAGWAAVFRQLRARSVVAERRVAPGDSIGPFTITAVSGREVSGLTAVHDPGFPVVLAALVLIAAGLALALLQREKEVRG